MPKDSTIRLMFWFIPEPFTQIETIHVYTLYIEEGHMMNRLNAILGGILLAGTTLFANAEPFVYQGTLQDQGQPANGLYEFQVLLFDAPLDGNQVAIQPFSNVTSIDGLFTIELNDDFVNPDARWLEIRVREQGVPGPFEALTPRTFITAAPFASYASAAFTDLNEPWNTSGQADLTFGEGDDVVLINRDQRVTSAEYFGFGADTNSFGGMYITTQPGGNPFYGFSTTGDADAYTYLHGPTQELITYISSTKIHTTSDDKHHVHVPSQFDHDLEARDFLYNAPKFRTYTIPPSAFQPVDTRSGRVSYMAGGGSGRASVNDEGSFKSMSAPVNLPDGAEITEIIAHFRDASNSREIQAQLRRTSMTGISNIIQTAGTGSSEMFFGPKSSIINSSNRVVSNNDYSYEILLTAGGDGWSTSTGLLYCTGVQLKYRVARPD